jgi:hypothetical protein
MSDAQIVLAFVFGDQPTTLDDKKTALVLAKECGRGVSRIAEAFGMPVAATRSRGLYE